MNCTTVNINNTINITINGSFAYGSLAIFTTTAVNNIYYHFPRYARSTTNSLATLDFISLASLDHYYQQY